MVSEGKMVLAFDTKQKEIFFSEVLVLQLFWHKCTDIAPVPAGPTPPPPHTSLTWGTCGKWSIAYGMLSVSTPPPPPLDIRRYSGGSPGGRPTHFLVTTHESSYDYSLFTHANAARSRGSRLPFEFDSGAGSASASDSESGSIPGSVSARGQAGSRGDASAWGGVVTGVEERRRWERCVEGTGSSAGGALLAYEIPEDW